MDRRQTPRVQVQIPVQVWGMDAHSQPFTHPALITNLSTGGLVLQGVARRIRIGEVLYVRMGEDKGQFRVVWIAASGTGELGMERMTANNFVPDAVLTHCAQAAAAC